VKKIKAYVLCQTFFYSKNHAFLRDSYKKYGTAREAKEMTMYRLHSRMKYKIEIDLNARPLLIYIMPIIITEDVRKGNLRNSNK
jgi:hypothetical protein